MIHLEGLRESQSRLPKVFHWAADLHGCGYYRMGLPAAALCRTGLASSTMSVLAGETQWASDVIIGQRLTPPDVCATWARLATEGKPLIFELDDDLWHLARHNPAYQFFHTEGRLERLTECVRQATLVTCSTAPLACMLREFNPNVRVIPNYIDNALLALPMPGDGPLTVGWAGSHNHRHDLQSVSHTVRKVFRDEPVTFHSVGFDARRILAAGRGRHTGWSQSVVDYYTRIDFHIGLAPLEDTRFNRCKTPIKALEYAALGIPVVASNVGPYRQFVQHGVTGFLADTPGEWGDYLRLLIHDEPLRRSMGVAARAQALDHLIVDHAREWRAVIDEALEGAK